MDRASNGRQIPTESEKSVLFRKIGPPSVGNAENTGSPIGLEGEPLESSPRDRPVEL